MLREVAHGIFLISQRKQTRLAPFFVNLYVIGGENGLVFDAGMGGRKSGAYLARQIRIIEKRMRERGETCRITRVLPSHGHWDHFSGVEYLRKTLGLKVLATPKLQQTILTKQQYRDSLRRETRLIQTPVSRFRKSLYRLTHWLRDELFSQAFKVAYVTGPVDTISDQAVFSINNETWHLMEMPGHCDDDIVLFNRSRGILLCGDIVLRSVNTWIGPPRSDLALYMDSLKKIRALKGLTLILPAHGSPIDQPYERLDQALEHRRKRTREVQTLVRGAGDRGIDFNTLFKTIYPSCSFQDRIITRGWILLTLKYLMDRDCIASRTEGGRVLFFPAAKIDTSPEAS